MQQDKDQGEPRIIAVKLPRRYYRAVRRLAAEHEVNNAQVVCWALDALQGNSTEGDPNA